MKKKANLKNGREKSIAIFHENQDFGKDLQNSIDFFGLSDILFLLNKCNLGYF